MMYDDDVHDNDDDGQVPEPDPQHCIKVLVPIGTVYLVRTC